MTPLKIKTLKSAVLAGTLACSAQIHAQTSHTGHGEKHESKSPTESAITALIQLRPTQKETAAGSFVYEFKIFDARANKNITDKDLKVEHEKKLHLKVYDPGLQDFQHVHPEFRGSAWKVPLEFSVDGEYWVWAQGKLNSGADFSVPQRLKVTKGKPANAVPAKLADMRKFAEGPVQLTLDNTDVTAGKEATLNITITRTDGAPVKLAPYLGAFAHVIATPESGDKLLHVHPMNGSKPNQGMIHATFPEPGGYRLWIQFLENGNLITAPVSIAVK